MKIAVLSASPKQQTSLTLQTVRVLKRMCKNDEFDISFIKDVNDGAEFEAKAKDADLVLILSSLYHMNTHGQLMRFLKGISIPQGKPVTYISTSGGNMDIPAHNYIRSYARHNGLKWIQSISLLDEDMLKDYRREELYRWFCYVKDVVNQTKLDGTSLKDLKVSICDCGDTAEETEATALELKKQYEALGAKVNLINFREKNLKGCIACFGCYTNNVCCIKDDFKEIDEAVHEGDLIVTVSGVNYNQFSTNYKYFLDRHVMYGRFSQEYEKTKVYVVCGDIDPQDYAELEQHTLVIDNLDRNYTVGIFDGSKDGIENSVYESALACIHDLFPQRNTHYYGLSLQFANLAYRLQKMTPKDYEFFKKKGFYEMPKVIEMVKPINNMEEGRMSCKMRLMAFEEMLTTVDGPPELKTSRGNRCQYETMIGADLDKVNGKPKKKGFSLFK